MRRIVHIAAVLALSWLTATEAAAADDPELMIEAPGKKMIFARATLLTRPDLETIVVDDAAYARPMRYRAVRFASLLGSFDIGSDATLEFVASDGFTSSVRFVDLRSATAGKSIAYLAIEEPSKPWPALGRDGLSGGPFYLVWKNPSLSGIGREQWPYRVARVQIKDSVERLYPATLPAASAGADVKQGHAIFVKNCLPCHQLNGAGPALLGPDLNLPLNPTEYFRDGILRRFIRDPGTVVAHPHGSMPKFPRQALSDADLDLLIAYLGHMAPRKVATTRP